MAIIKKWRAFIALVLLTIAGLLGYHLLWGRLFPASPLILGFTKRELPHLVLYVQDGHSGADFDWADSLVSEVEAFHGLLFQSKPKLFFFTDDDSYIRRSGGRTRVRAFYNGAVVVSPWIQREDAEGRLSLRIYLQHELSHSVLFQNMSLLACLRYPEWILEGVATTSAKQTGTFLYPSKDQTYEFIRRGYWMPPALFGTAGQDTIKLDLEYPLTFMYSEFACIVEDLIDRGGRELFLEYMKALFENRDHDQVFQRFFHIPFFQYLQDFRSKAATPPN